MDLIIDEDLVNLPAKSETFKASDSWLENCLLSLGFPEDNLPLGGFLQNYYDLAEGRWVVLTPILWEASHNDAMILAFGKQLNLEKKLAADLFDITKNFLSEIDIDLRYHDPYTWFFKLNKESKLLSCSPQAILHRSLSPVLKAMDSTLYWQKLFTELQMLYSSFGDKFLSKVNGVWFYGAEDFYLPADSALFSDDPKLLRAFPNRIKALNLCEEKRDLDKHDRFFIKNEKNINIKLAEKMRRYSLRWFWNNAAYKTKKLCWWQRLRRKKC